MKNIVNTIVLVVVGIFIILGCSKPKEANNFRQTTTSSITENKSITNQTKAKSVETKSEADEISSDSSVEFALDLSLDEKRKRLKLIKEMPEFSKVSEEIKKLGFNGCNLYFSKTDRNKPFIASSNLTGLLFGCDKDYKTRIEDREYKIVIMGQSKNSVDTVRIQSFGVFTKEVRQQLLKWAEIILTKNDKGSIPKEFSDKFYAGEQMGDGNGFQNGFYLIQASQTPSNGKSSTENDRISLDLIFDKRQ